MACFRPCSGAFCWFFAADPGALCSAMQFAPSKMVGSAKALFCVASLSHPQTRVHLAPTHLPPRET